MKILLEAELIADHAGMLEVRISNGFGNPVLHIAKECVEVVEEKGALVCEDPT